MTEPNIAEQAAELARTLPANSTLTADVQDVWIDDGTISGKHLPGRMTYLLNGEPISKELYDELVPIFEAARERRRRDPRWNWVDVSRIGSDPAHPEYVKGSCRHIELEPLTVVEADRLYRCRTCGAYLRTVRQPPDIPDTPS